MFQIIAVDVDTSRITVQLHLSKEVCYLFRYSGAHQYKPVMNEEVNVHQIRDLLISIHGID